MTYRYASIYMTHIAKIIQP